MSAYSDWKCGAITFDEYLAECNREEARDRYYEERQTEDREEEECISYS